MANKGRFVKQEWPTLDERAAKAAHISALIEMAVSETGANNRGAMFIRDNRSGVTYNWSDVNECLRDIGRYRAILTEILARRATLTRSLEEHYLSLETAERVATISDSFSMLLSDLASGELGERILAYEVLNGE